MPLLALDADGFEIETMMNVRALKAGLTIAEVPSFEAPRVHGVGRLRTIPDGTRVLRTIFRERLNGKTRVALNVGTQDVAEPAGARHAMSVGIPIEVGGSGRGIGDGTMAWASTSFAEPNSMDLDSHEPMIAR